MIFLNSHYLSVSTVLVGEGVWELMLGLALGPAWS